MFHLDDFSDVEWLFSINHFEFAHFYLSQSKILIANKIRLEKRETKKQIDTFKEKHLNTINIQINNEESIRNLGYECGLLNFNSQVELSQKLLDEMIKKTQGKQDENLYLLKTFSSIVYITNPHCFEVIRKYIPLFCENTVRHFLYPLKNQLHNSIRNYRYLPVLINHFYPKDHGIIYATLAGDAAQMYENDTARNVYCFELLPLDARYNVVPLYFEFFPKGSAPPIVREIYKDIISELRKLNIHVIFTATDSEKAIDKTHNDFFMNSILPQINKSFFEIVDSFSIDDIFPLSDILHLLKNARSHLLNHLIFVDSINMIFVNKYSMKIALRFPRFLTDVSKEGRMKDGYAIELFSRDTFIELEREGRYDASFFILPFLCLQESVRSSCLSWLHWI